MKILAALFGFVTASTLGLTAQGRTTNSLQGVWQAVEVTMPGTTPRTIAISEPRPNLTIITGRHYSRVQIDAEGPRPMVRDTAHASADELRALWGPVVAEAGTYDVSSDVITMHPAVSKNPTAMTPSAFTTWSYKLDGNTLIVTARANQDGPVPPVSVKAIRLE